uniref:Slc39a-9 n=1 Tax=Schmidtea mediterranea TaxID=79327 RepID=A0A0H3YJK8_SCHMD|nr:slc39a-9 [Schmidtea mediterranea]
MLYLFFIYIFLLIILTVMPLIMLKIFKNIDFVSKFTRYGLFEKRLLSFTMGLLLGDVFLNIMPMVWRNYKVKSNLNLLVAGLWTIGGLITFFICEKSLNIIGITVGRSADMTLKCYDQSDLNHNSNNNNNQAIKTKKLFSKKIKEIGYLALIVSCLENLFYGILMGTAFTLTGKIGLFTTLCVLIHEIPYELRDFVLLMHSGFDIYHTVLCQYFSSSWKIIGGLLCLILDEKLSNLLELWLLPVIGGALLYIALVIMGPFVISEQSPKESGLQLLFICVGISITACISLGSKSIPIFYKFLV